MTHGGWPTTWAPYMTWAKQHPKSRLDLTGSNLLPCTIDEVGQRLQQLFIDRLGYRSVKREHSL